MQAQTKQQVIEYNTGFIYNQTCRAYFSEN